MGDVASGITADSVLIGGASAEASANGQDDADTGGWQPGDGGTATQRAGELGLAALLLLGAGGSGGGDVPDVAGNLEDGYLGVVSRVLAGWDPGTAADELGSMLGEAVADGAYAELLTVTQVTIVSGQAALQWYLSNGGMLLQWTDTGDSHVCAACLDNSAADPRPAGVDWPGGVTAPPQHAGGCRCALAVVSGGAGVPGGPGVIDTPEDAGADDSGGEGEEPEESDVTGEDEGGGESGDEEESGSEGEEPEAAEPAESPESASAPSSSSLLPLAATATAAAVADRKRKQ
jgi:hypothetical protein